MRNDKYSLLIPTTAAETSATGAADICFPAVAHER